MKKQYVKPTMLVEDFVLNDYIAVCNLRVNQNADGCAAPSGMDMQQQWLWNNQIFMQQVGCIKMVDSTEYNGMYCYHTPNGTNVIVAS